jgi:hypothetical protein
MPSRYEFRRLLAIIACSGFLFSLLSDVGAESKRRQPLSASAKSPFDLDGKRLHFAPNASGGYDVTDLPLAFDANFGTNLNAGDDTNHRISFTAGFSFPFFGVTWDHVFVRSNANVTFGGIGNPDFYDPNDFLLELPMIAALFADLNPAAGGRVLYRQAADRFLVTWDRLPEFDTNNSNTLQLTLFPDGSFDFAYNGVDIRIPINGSPAVAGFNSGGPEIKFTAVDLSTLPITGSNAAALYEAFPTPALYEGPASGSVAQGASVSTDAFPLVEGIGVTELKRVPREKRDHAIKLIKTSAQQVAPTGPAGTNEVYDPSAKITKPPSELNAPIQVSNFEGIGFSGFIPPDPHTAVGPNHVMGVVNSQFGIFDKSGTLLKLIDADTWYGSVLPGEGPGDPQIVYDHHSQRWFMVWHNAAAPPITMLLSVSDDSNPLGAWCNWALPGDQLGSTPSELFNDYPKIGVDANAFYVTDNMGAFVRLRIIPKAQLLSNTCGPVTWTDFWNLRDPDLLLAPAFTVIPAVTFGTPGVEYLISDSPHERGTFMTLWSLADPLGTPSLTGVNVPVVESLGEPSNAQQLGGGQFPIEVGGRRVRNAVYMNGSIWTAHSIAGGTNRDFVFARYVRIDVNTATALEDVALGADNFWYYYPAIHPDANGNLFMTFTRSGLTEYAGARYTGRLQADPPGLQASALLKAGEANYAIVAGNRNRWGDYLGIALDPADSSKVWMFGQYATSSGRWGTWFGQTTFAPLPGRQLRFDPQSIRFDTLEVGESSDPITIALSNLGTDDVTISSITAATPSFVLSGLPSLPLTLSSFGEATFSVKFAPATAGTLSDTIRIESNDSTNPLAKIALSGRVLGTAAFSGAVKDSVTNAPIQATLTFFRRGETQPRATVSTGANGAYSVSVLEGIYDILIKPEIPYPETTRKSLVHTLTGTTQDLLLRPVSIVIVEDQPPGATTTEIYRTLLTQLGYPFTVWNISAQGRTVPADRIRLLAKPGILLWTTGETTADVLTPADRAVIRGHLDGGNSLILTGDNIAETSPANDSLLALYLGVQFNSNVSTAAVTAFAGDPIGAGLRTSASGSSKDQLQLTVSPRSRVSKVFYYGNTPADTARIAAVRAEERAARWKAAYFGFRLESVNVLHRRAVLERTLNWIKSPLVRVEEKEVAVLPQSFRLEQNHPNPFWSEATSRFAGNPTTIIAYELPVRSQVTLKVYDLLGQEMATLVSEIKAAGRHRVSFDASRLSGGVYFYRLQAGEFSDTKKLVLLR